MATTPGTAHKPKSNAAWIAAAGHSAQAISRNETVGVSRPSAKATWAMRPHV